MAAQLGLEAAHSPLDAVLRRAGARLIERAGWLIAADFGSMTSEMAVCRRTGGLADVSDMGKFEVRGAPDELALVHRLEEGRAGRVGRAWWAHCAPDALLVVCSPELRRRVHVDLAERCAGRDVRVTDVTTERAALCLIGPVAPELLAAAGTGLVPVGAVRSEMIAGVATLVLRQSERRWLLVAPAASATELWLALSELGVPLGLAHVGADALQHLLAAGAG